MKYLNFLALLALISCSGGATRKDVDQAGGYRTSGVEQFFLPELPQWANASSSGACFKDGSFQYLDFSKLSASYQLDYGQMLELQAQYNERLENYYRSTAVRFLKPVEEASLFSNTLEQVRAGVKQLKIPVVHDVDVVWLDGFTKDGQEKELKKMAASGRFDQRLPILFSSCHSKQRLVQWISENDLEKVGLYTISAEFLSPFGSDLTLKSGLRLELAKLLGPNVKIHLITPSATNTPTELILP